MAEALLSLEGLVKSFDQTRVLDGLSLTVGEGEFVTLLGPSGCGKTTTLRVIAGQAVPDKGIEACVIYPAVPAFTGIYFGRFRAVYS